MSFPLLLISHNFTDFCIKESHNAISTGYEIFQNDDSLLSITIPHFCEEEKTKLGIFLKDFSPFLCEMLVKWNKDVVERFFKESMAKLFPNSAGDYELGFYERQNQFYCTVQYTAEAYKRIFGSEMVGTYAETLSQTILPPKRLKFQKKDETWEKIFNAIEARRKAAKKRITIRDLLQDDL